MGALTCGFEGGIKVEVEGGDDFVVVIGSYLR